VSVSCETGALPALKLFGETAFDMVFLDLVLPGMHGLECLKRLKEKRPEVPVVIISGGLRELLQEKLLCCGAQEFIQKPFDISQIVDALERRRGGPPARQSRAPVLSSCGSA